MNTAPVTAPVTASTVDIENRFTYHSPKGDQATRYQELRESAKALALLIDKHCPKSREASTALTMVQNASMWANAAITINE